ncbi:helix-turn-helix domain-containing protein [Candidatus Margulisiibacteriota bacterium]
MSVEGQEEENMQDQGQEQPEKISTESIGALLKATREQQGLSLEKVSEITKLRKRYIQALEEDDFEVLPNKIVARGFLKIYSDRVGLDVKAICKRFDERFPEKNAENKNMPRTPEQIYKASGAEMTSKPLVPGALQSTPIKNSSSHQTFLTFITKRYRHYFYYGIAIVIILFIFMHFTSLFLKGMNRNPQTTRRFNRDLKITQQTPEQLVQQNKGFEGVIVIARPLSKTWMRAYIDGIVNFRGPVDKGVVKQFQGKQSVRIKVGNGKAVDLLVNKKHYGRMSQEEKIVDKRFYPPSAEEAVSLNETEYTDPSIINTEFLSIGEESTENAQPPDGELSWQERIKRAREAKEKEKVKAEGTEKKEETGGGWW